jgi:hypothetical protein
MIKQDISSSMTVSPSTCLLTRSMTVYSLKNGFFLTEPFLL